LTRFTSIAGRCLLAAGLTAAARQANAQCYAFSGPGVTYTMNILSVTTSAIAPPLNQFVVQQSSVLTVGGRTYTASVGPASLAFHSAVGQTSIDIDFVDTFDSPPWTAQVFLAGVLTLLPSAPPASLPSASAWNSLELDVTVAGGALAKYAITSVGACSSSQTPSTVPGQTLGDPASMPGACPCGEPINTGTGNLFQQVTDYQTAGANQLVFTRYYNSLANSTTFATTLGANWRSNYDRYLRLSPFTVIADRPNGQQVTFSSNGGGVWTTDTDIDLALTNSGSNWTLTDSHDTVESYTATGTNQATLQTIKARNGYTQTLQYGNGNQLASVTDSYRKQLSFAYSGGQIQSVTTPDGLVLSFGYASGNLIVVGYSTSPPTTLTYLYENTALPSALTGIVDQNGTRYVSWTYDSTGRALSSQHAGGAGLTTVAYNDTDGSRTVTNELGEQYLEKFTPLQGVPKLTEADRLANATIPAGKSSFTYDSNGYPASYTDWNGNVTNFVNDVHGQLTSITEAFGTPQARTTTVTYHSTFHLPVQIAAPGLTAAFTYDISGELLTRTLTDTAIAGAATRTWTYTWSNFLETSVKGPRTDVSALTRFAYDSTGALTGITNALNQTIQITRHTQGGLPQTIVDRNGVVTNLTYDARQRILSVAVTTAAGVLTNSYAYDAAGNLLTVTPPDGSSLTNTYDGAHRLTGIGDSIAYTLDALGDRTQVTALDPGGNPQLKRTGVFDALGRVLQSMGGASQTTGFAYDANGNTLAVTDPLTHATQQSFDALNRQITSTDAAGGVAAFAYDAHNRLTRVTDANGVVTTFSYDGFGDLIQQSSPAAGTITYRYDSGGNLTQKIDARGLTSNFTYDALNRVISTTYPANSSENVAYSYDQPGHGFGIGRLTSVADAAGSLSRSYDERGNLLTETRTHGSIALATSYTYDAASRLASITYPSKWSVAYTRDSAGRITAATAQAPGGSPQSIVSSVAYQPFGPVSALTYGNGIAEKRTFDLDYRLTGIASANVQNLSYGYDAADNLLSAADGISSANNQSLGYDALNRLTSASGAYGSLGYTYDANGNRLTETSTASSDGLGPVTALTYNQPGRLATVSTGSRS
jgi:YD repeat-containing protein